MINLFSVNVNALMLIFQTKLEIYQNICVPSASFTTVGKKYFYAFRLY
jgi:hypothetical protein